VARQRFALNSEPHVAEIGDDITLEFQPEVMGDEFLDAFESLQEMFTGLGIDPNNIAATDADKVRQAVTGVRLFLAGLMLPDSARQFARWEVHHGGEVVAVYGTPDEARGRAAELDGAQVVDAGLRLPDRILIQLMEWVVEVYGQRPPTSSSGSATPSPPRGRRGTGSSRSRASTPTPGH
jgi:hypothetical protein